MLQIIKASQQQIIDRGKFIIRLFALGSEIANYNDKGLYQLGRVDHATLEGGMVVPMHLHQNDEILSYIRKGSMIHKDSQNNEVKIHNSYIMMMNAGTGFYHEEAVPYDSETVDMLQIFIRPRKDNLPPKVQFHKLSHIGSTNKWRLIGGNEESKAPLKINSDILVYDAKVYPHHSIDMPKIESSQIGYLYLFDGSAKISESDKELSRGDAIVFSNQNFTISAVKEIDLVLFILDKKAPISKNGLYSQ